MAHDEDPKIHTTPEYRVVEDAFGVTTAPDFAKAAIAGAGAPAYKVDPDGIVTRAVIVVV